MNTDKAKEMKKKMDLRKKKHQAFLAQEAFHEDTEVEEMGVEEFLSKLGED
jgi:hypothetical protein